MYQVTRLFLNGTLKGLEITRLLSSPMPVGFVCMKPIGGSAYKITACVKVG